MLRDNDSPDKALRFSNLCSRLLTLPVLTQKWAILYFLDQLTEPGFINGAPASTPNGAQSDDIQKARARGNDSATSIFNDAFAPGGLARLPANTSRPQSSEADPQNGNLKTREKTAPIVETPDTASGDMATKNEIFPTEAALLHDLPFTLQGLSTTHLAFTDDPVLKLPPTLPLPLISLLHTLAEPSLLYRSLSSYIQSRDEGLVSQSLRAAIGGELRSYLGLIAALEGEIRRALTSLKTPGTKTSSGRIGVTLKRCVIWTREATMGLRLMSIMVEEAKSKSADLTHILVN